MIEENYPKIDAGAIKKKTEAKKTELPYEVSGITIHVPYAYAEKLKDYCFWDGYNQKEVALQALIEFLDKKDPQQRPERVRNKKKPGRKPNLA